MAVELLVAGLAPEDAGRGIARLERGVMEQLGVEPGDVLRIDGRRTTVARAMPAGEGGPETTVRIDGNTRMNAGAGMGDRVTVSGVDAGPAKRITVAHPPYMTVRGAEPYIKRGLMNRPVVRGDTVRVGFLGRPLVFVVTGSEPSGAVVVDEHTEVRIRESPITEEDLRGDRVDLPSVTYEDVGGLDRELERVRETIELPMRHPELFRRLGIEPPKGVLLHGPPGTGKTLIARAVANEVDASFHTISGPEIMSKYYGESEEQLREIFDEAEENSPAIVFIDELDSIAPSRERVTGEVERRVVAQLLSLMDGLEERGQVIVIGATNRVDAIDPALRRGGRFDREIEIGVPDREGREEVLQIHTRGMPLANDVDLPGIADRTYGYVGADLQSLAKEAAMSALRRVQPEIVLDEEAIPAEVLERIEVTREDFEGALGTTAPSAMREVFVEVPDVTYEDVGGLDPVKRELIRSVEWPLAYPGLFDRLGTQAPRGVLLYGPPGTGKTLVAKALANASDANFISVKGPEVLDKFVGESERAIREIFERARQNAPTIVFFDEIDAIAPERGGSFDTGVTERVVSQLLTELDGVEELSDVFVLGATNRPDIVDPALLRPGRLEKLVYVPVPDEAARRAILEVHTRGTPLADDVDLDALARGTEGYTGGDVEALVREASMIAMDDYLDGLGGLPDPETVDANAGALVVGTEQFERALAKTIPSVSADTREFYDGLAERLGGRADASIDESWVGFQ